jgi:hypothetical protein
VLCNLQQRETNPSTQVRNCQLYIEHEIEAYGIGFFLIRFDEETELAVDTTSDSLSSTNLFIESADLSLTYLPAMTGPDGVYFLLTDEQYLWSKIIGFDVRYWQSY